MGTAQVVFEEVERGGATGSHVTGSDVSHVTGSDVTGCHVTGRDPDWKSPARKRP